MHWSGCEIQFYYSKQILTPKEWFWEEREMFMIQQENDCQTYDMCNNSTSHASIPAPLIRQARAIFWDGPTIYNQKMTVKHLVCNNTTSHVSNPASLMWQTSAVHVSVWHRVTDGCAVLLSYGQSPAALARVTHSRNELCLAVLGHSWHSSCEWHWR